MSDAGALLCTISPSPTHNSGPLFRVHPPNQARGTSLPSPASCVRTGASLKKRQWEGGREREAGENTRRDRVSLQGTGLQPADPWRVLFVCERMWYRRRVFPLDTYTTAARGRGCGWAPQPALTRDLKQRAWAKPLPHCPGITTPGSVLVVRLRSPQSQAGSLPLCGRSALLHTSASKTPVKWLYNPDLCVYWGLRKCVCAGEEGGAFKNLAKLNGL